MSSHFAENSFTEQSIVKWHNCDLSGEFRPYAFLNMAQEIAGFHANKLGFGYYDLIKENQAWVLSRIKVVYLSHPRWCDKVTLETWHKGMQSLFGVRDFVLHNEDGSKAIVATSSWLVMNTKTHRIDRNNLFNSSIYLNTKNNDANAIEEPCGRIRREANPEYVRTHTVRYSDVDFLGHTNNAKYVEWITDSIDLSVLKEYKISSFQINFNAETKVGEEIQIYMAPRATESQQTLTLYFEGRRGETTVFESEFVFAK